MLRPIIAIAVALCASPVSAAELPSAFGMYSSTNNAALPLVDSKLEVTVRGPIVEVVVTQRFHNRADHATEATYIFPLPPDAAVSAMWIKSGSKTIRAQIARREEALQRYEAAVRAGVTAAVLDQERPDVFTQTVAGIAPRSTVEVTLRYDALAHFYDGAWGLAIPMVVAPRYTPGVATSRPTTGTGRAPDTDRAPDASRVTPAGSPGAGGPTSVTIQFVDKAWDITSPTHELTVAGSKVTFVDPRSDHDAIIRWKAAAAAGWVEPGGFAAVVVQAPAAPPQRTTALRCMLVLDRSAAARGDADALAQPLVRHVLASVGATDSIAVHGSSTLAWARPSAIQRSLDATWSQPTGPFDLTRVLATARPNGAPIVLVTSGLVTDDRAAVAAAKKLGVPVHVIGVGPAPARGLLLQIATATGGTARFASPGDDLRALARAVVADIATPAPALTVNWGTLGASDVVPGTLPRLGAGQAIVVLARVQRAQTANARAGGELFAIDVLPAARTVAGATTTIGPLGRRWARSKLEEMLTARAPVAAVTAHALRYGLVSPHTSMVAIGTEVVVEGGTRRSVAVPVSVPAGMKWQQVKKETTVETSANTVSEQPAARDTAKKPAAPTVERPQHALDAAPADAEDEEHDDAEPSRARIDVGTAMSSEVVLTADRAVESSIGLGRRLRLTASFGAGVARAAGDSASLFAVGTRLEYGTANLLGIDGSLALVDGEAQGRILLGFARRGIARWLELGVGAGTQLGAGGVGPAGALSLRVHLPPLPRAATFLRYDAAYLVDDEDVRRGQHALTLGVEWGF